MNELMSPIVAINAEPPQVWLRTFTEFEPELRGYMRFGDAVTRDRFAAEAKPGALVVIYGHSQSKSLPKSKIVGILQISGKSNRAKFYMPDELSDSEDSWAHAVEVVRAWKFIGPIATHVKDFASNSYSPDSARANLGKRATRLTSQEAKKLLTLEFQEIPVFGQPAPIDAKPLLGKKLFNQRAESNLVSEVVALSSEPNREPFQSVWPDDSSAYITSFWGWRPETWGCIGFGTEGRRNTYLRETTDPFIMVVFITETAPTDQPELRGKVVGFYELSHEVGSREEFTDKKHHTLEKGKWPYSLRAIRAFSFLPEFQMDIRTLIQDYGRSNATNIGAHGRELSDEQIAQLRALPFEQVPVFRGETLISEDVLFAEPRKGRTRSGAVNRSGFSIPGEPIDTPKELYILKLHGDTAAFLGREAEGESIYKIGLSMSPKRRLASFRKAMPKGVFTWSIDRTTRQEFGKPYANYEIALAGEEAMKDHLEVNADWRDGEFYAATETEIERAWQAGKSAAKDFQTKETAND